MRDRRLLDGDRQPEMYARGGFSPGPRLTAPRDAHTATPLPDGRGGHDDRIAVSRAAFVAR
jgi:hypothetical protein